jgi:hypothetical protein
MDVKLRRIFVATRSSRPSAVVYGVSLQRHCMRGLVRCNPVASYYGAWKQNFRHHVLAPCGGLYYLHFEPIFVLRRFDR